MAGKWEREVVLAVWKEGGWVGPTRIATLVRGTPGVHSSWASPICQRLVRQGILRRNHRGHYQVVRGQALNDMLDGKQSTPEATREGGRKDGEA